MNYPFNQRINFTPTDYKIIKLLVANYGDIVSAETIQKEVWGYSGPFDTQIIRLYIGRIRKKIGDDPSNPSFIKVKKARDTIASELEK